MTIHPKEYEHIHWAIQKYWTKIVSKFREKWIGGKQPTFPREISLQGTRTEFLLKFNNSPCQKEKDETHFVAVSVEEI